MDAERLNWSENVSEKLVHSIKVISILGTTLTSYVPFVAEYMDSNAAFKEA